MQYAGHQCDKYEYFIDYNIFAIKSILRFNDIIEEKKAIHCDTLYIFV